VGHRRRCAGVLELGTHTDRGKKPDALMSAILPSRVPANRPRLLVVVYVLHVQGTRSGSATEVPAPVHTHIQGVKAFHPAREQTGDILRAVSANGVNGRPWRPEPEAGFPELIEAISPAETGQNPLVEGPRRSTPSSAVNLCSPR